uniref:Uncharacterized protein n=1 Tax=Rhizophora mucronata TaxID=61149 RepID=A0A2P2P3A3_RHIMU
MQKQREKKIMVLNFLEPQLRKITNSWRCRAAISSSSSCLFKEKLMLYQSEYLNCRDIFLANKKWKRWSWWYRWSQWQGH